MDDGEVSFNEAEKLIIRDQHKAWSATVEEGKTRQKRTFLIPIGKKPRESPLKKFLSTLQKTSRTCESPSKKLSPPHEKTNSRASKKK
ncbi:hypothetical protein Y032_0146g2556 [Ancylostoma ceylanicum]|uniref:Uncharacterized protein n=1 Tax=Ancylostoma ceylanicum TaxID=53326 RepID=A0A016T2C1_9BILA|nr:hypothetical protein Y032_0146g2556 [Ancylostoma ceylanicum]